MEYEILINAFKTITDLATNIFVLLLGIYGLSKIISEISQIKFTKSSEIYKNSKKFIDDYNNNLHPLIVENGFAAISGKTLNYDEIIYLISLNNPSQKIRHRIAANDLLVFNNTTKSYDWKKNDKFIKYNLKYNGRLYMFFYFFFSTAGIYPIFYYKYTISSNAYLIIFILTMMSIAITSLLEHDKFKLAHFFLQSINEQFTDKTPLK